MHRQAEIAQETPYRFQTVGRAARAPTAAGPTAAAPRGSLLLVNHWVDTTPAPRPDDRAARSTRRASSSRRLARCRRERRMLPNIVAVDFYRQGDVLGQVAKLNRAAAR